MKMHFPALAAAICLLATSSAQADQTWQFDYMSLTSVYPSENQLTLLSQSKNATVVSLTSFADLTKTYAVEVTSGSGGSSIPDTWYGDTAFFKHLVTVADGYRITGVTLDLDIKGDLRPGEPNGVTHNTMRSSMVVWEDNIRASTPQIDDLNGTVHQSVALSGLNYVDAFELDVQSSISNYAAAGYFYIDDAGVFTFNDASYAGIWAENATLTFHTAPVPEPTTYVMLIGGLAVLGFATRRRKA